MAYLQNSSNTVISDARSGSFANVTIQNAGSLVVDYAHTFQGTISGYTAGGVDRDPVYNNDIKRFPFATDTNATVVGSLNFPGGKTIAYASGQSSDTSGYASGGYYYPYIFTSIISKFAFVNETFGTTIGNLTQARWNSTGQSSSTHGYASGGSAPTPAYNPKNTIDKFPFSADSSATDVGDLNQGRRGQSGQSSSTHGYASGGSSDDGSTTSAKIAKFSFSVDENASDIGDLTQARVIYAGQGQSSTTHGYASGGIVYPATNVNTIDKFPFSSNTNATDVGDLTQVRNAAAGQSSTTHGYTSGGGTGSEYFAPFVNTIDKFPFATDTNATDVGDLPIRNSGFLSGQQD